MANKCQYLIERLKENRHLDKNEEWYEEFVRLYGILRGKDYYNELFSRVKKINGEEIFNEIEDNFKKYKGTIKFISFILEKYPYEDYKEKYRDFNTYNIDLIEFLLYKYCPDNFYPKSEEELLTYCIHLEIFIKLRDLCDLFYLIE